MEDMTHERMENLRYKKEDFEKIIYSVYENDGLIRKIRSKENISRDLLEKIIEEVIEFNGYVEKDENIAKLNIEYILNRDLEIENLEILNDIGKNEYDVDIKFRSKEELAKYIRKIYLEKKWLKTSYYRFLITRNFKSFQKIRKIKINRNGINLCLNENNEIVCMYLFYLYDNLIYEIVYLFEKFKINIEKEINKLSKKINNEECTICKDEIKEGIKLECNHVFHKTCIIEWFNINQTCPLCRIEFIDKITKLLKLKEKYDLKDFENYIFEDKII